MRPSGGAGQPTKSSRRKPKMHKKANAPARARRLFIAELQDELNALKRELTEAVERQTATAEVLNVISRSTFQLQPVLDTIVKTASRLCNAETALIFMFRDDKLHVVATSNASSAFVQHALEHPLTPGRGSLTGRTFLERQTVHLPDCLADPEYTLLDFQAVGKYRSVLGVPLLREGVPIGVIPLLRTAVLPFTDTEIDLVKTFADQAVIAIENVRLFEAEQERTRELTESLQQQTATANVLKVISRSTFDLQTVLDALVESATRLCDADRTWLFQREGEYFRWSAGFGLAADAHARVVELFRDMQVPVDRGSLTGRAALEGRVIHVPDVLADPDYNFWGAQAAQKIGAYRAALGVPLLRQGEVVGVLSHRTGYQYPWCRPHGY
jgi:two-component system NtrC family sensor kinase